MTGDPFDNYGADIKAKAAAEELERLRDENLRLHLLLIDARHIIYCRRGEKTSALGMLEAEWMDRAARTTEAAIENMDKCSP